MKAPNFSARHSHAAHQAAKPRAAHQAAKPQAAHQAVKPQAAHQAVKPLRPDYLGKAVGAWNHELRLSGDDGSFGHRGVGF